MPGHRVLPPVGWKTNVRTQGARAGREAACAHSGVSSAIVKDGDLPFATPWVNLRGFVLRERSPKKTPTCDPCTRAV